MDAIAEFRTAVETRDLGAAERILAPDIVFHSPILHRPFEGIDAARAVLAAVLQVLEDFRYMDELHGDGVHCLIFRARVGDRDLEGIDILRLDRDGLISDFTVMVRPLTAAQALAQAMAEKLGLAGSA